MNAFLNRMLMMAAKKRAYAATPRDCKCFYDGCDNIFSENDAVKYFGKYFCSTQCILNFKETEL